MKISNTASSYINQAYSQNRPPNTATRKTGPDGNVAELQADSIQLSERTRDIQKISAALEKTPDIRSEVVAQLKTSIQNGRYNVDAEKIAEKMAGTLTDELI